VLNALNIRLDAESIAFILQHGNARALLTDRELSPIIRAALRLLERPPLVVDIDDPEFTGGGDRLGEIEYEDLLREGDPRSTWRSPADEWQTIALNYTSGTTGNPKGVVYHHRGAYLNALGNVVASSMSPQTVYLWTLPMFHCNGWCYPWALAVVAGTSVCLRKVDAAAVFSAIHAHRVTHFCCAPVVLNMLLNAPRDRDLRFDHGVEVMTGGAAPPAPVIAQLETLGIKVTHLYGLTETYGPSVSCAWHDEWDRLPAPERARLKSRVGVKNAVVEDVAVLRPETLEPVPHDGQTIGEVMIRGNTVMKGYLKNPRATEEAFTGGWFHTGDLGVVHADGYIQIKDPLEDIVISGGENISSIEVEEVLYRHPAVFEAAVVARPDAIWGETPCAFVTLKDGADTTAEVLIAFCRAHMASFKIPRHVVFGPLPKTATGKVQKYLLREQAIDI